MFTFQEIEKKINELVGVDENDFGKINEIIANNSDDSQSNLLTKKLQEKFYTNSIINNVEKEWEKKLLKLGNAKEAEVLGNDWKEKLTQIDKKTLEDERKRLLKKISEKIAQNLDSKKSEVLDADNEEEFSKLKEEINSVWGQNGEKISPFINNSIELRTALFEAKSIRRKRDCSIDQVKEVINSLERWKKIYDLKNSDKSLVLKEEQKKFFHSWNEYNLRKGGEANESFDWLIAFKLLKENTLKNAEYEKIKKEANELALVAVRIIEETNLDKLQEIQIDNFDFKEIFVNLEGKKINCQEFIEKLKEIRREQIEKFNLFKNSFEQPNPSGLNDKEIEAWLVNDTGLLKDGISERQAFDKGWNDPAKIEKGDEKTTSSFVRLPILYISGNFQIEKEVLRVSLDMKGKLAKLAADLLKDINSKTTSIELPENYRKEEIDSLNDNDNELPEELQKQSVKQFLKYKREYLKKEEECISGFKNIVGEEVILEDDSILAYHKFSPSGEHEITGVQAGQIFMNGWEDPESFEINDSGEIRGVELAKKYDPLLKRAEDALEEIWISFFQGEEPTDLRKDQILEYKKDFDIWRFDLKKNAENSRLVYETGWKANQFEWKGSSLLLSFTETEETEFIDEDSLSDLADENGNGSTHGDSIEPHDEKEEKLTQKEFAQQEIARIEAKKALSAEEKQNLSPKIEEQKEREKILRHLRKKSILLSPVEIIENENSQKTSQYLIKLVDEWKALLEIKEELKNEKITKKPFKYEVHEDNISYIEEILPLVEEVIKTNTKETLKNLLDNWTNNYPDWNDKAGGWKGRLELYLKAYDEESVKKTGSKSNESSGEEGEIKKFLVEKLDLNPDATEEEILTDLNTWFSSLEEYPKQLRKVLVNYVGLLSQEINKLQLIIDKTDDENKKSICQTEQAKKQKELKRVFEIGTRIKTSRSETHQAQIEVNTK